MYQHGKRTKAPRNASVFLAALIIIGAVVLVAWYIVHKDVGNSTGPKTDVPIVTEVGVGDGGDKLRVDESLFSFELPADWKLLERKSDSDNINAYIYTATKKGADDRKLTIHVDIMPRSYKLVKMWPISPNGSKFSLGNLSGDCLNFAGGAGARQQTQGNAPVPAKWENVSFVCDPIKNNQTIGTGTPDASIGTKLGQHTYFFYFEDHNIYPDDNILRGVLTSFQAK